MNISESRWLEVLTYCGVRAGTAARWAPLFAEHIQPDRFSLGLREIDDFVGQVLHETQMLEKLVENLNYSPDRLMEVWPGRFPTLASATPVAWSPERLANRVYGGRMGNTEMGDGYKYRGRGIPMVTGKFNYHMLEKLTGEPLVYFPERLEDPEVALRVGLLWWEKRVPDAAIDTLERVTRAVNGSVVGLPHRGVITERAKQWLS